MTTPITSLDLPDAAADLAAVSFNKGLAILVMAGFSAVTSLAGLSRRSPLNAACRMLPSLVQPANSISATSSGFSQCTSRVLRGAFAPANGLRSEEQTSELQSQFHLGCGLLLGRKK